MSGTESTSPAGSLDTALVLQPGVPVTLKLDGSPPKEYRLEVDSAAGSVLYLSVPVQSGDPVRFQPGTPVHVAFGDDASECAPGFFTWVLQIPPEEGPCLAVALPAQWEAHQRRKQLRFRVSLAATISLLGRNQEGDPAIDAAKHFAAFTENISLGGMALRCSIAEFRTGDRVRISLVLHQRVQVAVLGLVTRVQPTKRLVGVRFTEVPDRFRQELAAFLVSSERSRRATDLSLRLLGVDRSGATGGAGVPWSDL